MMKVRSKSFRALLRLLPRFGHVNARAYAALLRTALAERLWRAR
jgi:hypothetical protein